MPRKRHTSITPVISRLRLDGATFIALFWGTAPVIEGHAVKDKNSGTSEDQRNHPRFRVDIRLKVITGVASNGKAFFGRGSDISEGGMRVFVPADLEIGEAVTLELALPYTDRKVLVRGVLRNRMGFSYGVEYSASTTPEEREVISRACRALSLVQ